MHLYHPRTARQTPVPANREELSQLRSRGFFLAQELVDTVNGHVVQISCEPSVNSGRGPEQALELIRSDYGNEGKPAFVTVEKWQAMSEAERARLVVHKIERGGAPARPNPSETVMEASRSEHERLLKENEELKRQLDDLTAPRAVA